MRTCRYLIVGGGLTADAACKGIRERDGEGAICLVGDESFPPYARPPLTKALWKGEAEDTVWCGTVDLGVDLRLGRTVVSLDLAARMATDDTGKAIPMSACCSRPAGGPADFHSAAMR
jgi:3-phenylpropionate/trans-cinnamate dioxygenase ferredoxin reductase subunit